MVIYVSHRDICKKLNTSHRVSGILQKAFVKVYSVEREWGENPLGDTVGVCVQSFYVSSAKAGHWETEKAEHKNA